MAFPTTTQSLGALLKSARDILHRLSAELDALERLRVKIAAGSDVLLPIVLECAFN